MKVHSGTTIGAALYVVAVVASLAACAPVGADRADPPSDAREAAPEFSGPYAGAFRQAWSETSSPFVRSVIEDERITDQEWAEVGTRLSSCLEAAHIVFLGFEASGGYGVDPGSLGIDEASESLAKCEHESGESPIGSLRLNSIINPDNVDFDELIAACLVDKGVAERGYTAEDYRDQAAMLFDSNDNRLAKTQCVSDPLGLIR